MRRALAVIGVSLAGIAALVLGTGGGVAAGKPTKHTGTCSATLVTQPGSTDAKGTAFGFINCSAPFGYGVTHLTRTSTSSMGKVHSTGKFKNWSNTGTVHGTYKNTAIFTTTENATATGTEKFTGGTGAFKGATGKGTENCSTTNGGQTFKCTFSYTITF